MTRDALHTKHEPALLARLLVALTLAIACGTATPLEARATDGPDDAGAPPAIAAEELPQDDGAAEEPPLDEGLAAEVPGEQEAAPAQAVEAPQPTDACPGPEASQAKDAPTSEPVDMAIESDETGVGEPDQPDTTDDSSAAFSYEHDPRDNPHAMADIVVDENAVYGFAPSPDGSLKQYADADWSDPDIVESGRRERIAYHESLSELYDLLREMMADGASTEEIARAVSTKRNELRIASYANDPEGLARLKQRNLEQYGNENGGTPEFFYEKYGSWETVIDKSFSVNSGMDACLGLYDDYYDVYVASGQVPPDPDDPDYGDDESMPDIAIDDGSFLEPVIYDTIDVVDLVTTPVSSEPSPAGAWNPRPSQATLPATGDERSSAPLVLCVASMGMFLAAAVVRRREAETDKAA